MLDQYINKYQLALSSTNSEINTLLSYSFGVEDRQQRNEKRNHWNPQAPMKSWLLQKRDWVDFIPFF